MRFIPNRLEPNEYCGLIFNLPKDQIPVFLASELAEYGALRLWQCQAFHHHEHPALGDADHFVELDQSEGWAHILAQRFPDYRFIIEIYPMDRISWFQAMHDAPTEDGDEWELYSAPFRSSTTDLQEAVASFTSAESYREEFKKRTPRTGAEGSCDRCDADSNFGEPYDDPRHRGVRLIQCNVCRAEVIYATRVIRNKIGF